jgi:hypothetical protein
MAGKKSEVVQIQPLVMNRALITIKGVTPLLVHNWGSKALRQMEEAQMQSTKAKTRKRAAKNPWEDTIEAAYWLTGQPEEYTEAAFNAAIVSGAKTGFPLTAVKQAAASAAFRKKWTANKMELRSTMFLSGTDVKDMLTIVGTPEQRMDPVKIGMGTADLRYRPCYPEWEASFFLEYDANGGWSLENLINCINAGGMFVGIGEWRPEKDGDFGRFKVSGYADVKGD